MHEAAVLGTQASTHGIMSLVAHKQGVSLVLSLKSVKLVNILECHKAPTAKLCPIGVVVCRLGRTRLLMVDELKRAVTRSCVA